MVWSLQTGKLLDVLPGHEAPISSIVFNPIRPVLASGSWDKTVRIWDIFDNKGAPETVGRDPQRAVTLKVGFLTRL